jgi:hypothetical protein
MIVLRRAFIAASLAWTATLPLATWLASRAHNNVAAYAFTLGIYGIGSLVCHQLPARSFQLWGAQMPVCARCTGIYLGGAVVAAVAAVSRRLSPRADPDGARRRRDRFVVMAAALPTAATLVFEWTTGQTPAGTTRAVAGLPLGAAVSWIVARSG